MLLPLRHHHLKARAKSAKQCRQVLLGEERHPMTQAKHEGSIFHALLFNTVTVVRMPDSIKKRAGGDWKDFEAAHEGCLIANAKEWELGMRMTDAVRGHKLASELLIGARTEVTQLFDRDNPFGGKRQCRATPDIWMRGAWIADLKSAADIDPSEPGFIRAAYQYRYHSAQSWYRQIDPGVQCFLIAVEKHTCEVVVYRYPDAVLEAGARWCDEQFLKIVENEATGRWPGYAEAAVELGLPSWAPEQIPFDDDAANDNAPDEAAAG